MHDDAELLRDAEGDALGEGVLQGLLEALADVLSDEQSLADLALVLLSEGVDDCDTDAVGDALERRDGDLAEDTDGPVEGLTLLEVLREALWLGVELRENDALRVVWRLALLVAQFDSDVLLLAEELQESLAVTERVGEPVTLSDTLADAQLDTLALAEEHGDAREERETLGELENDGEPDAEA